MSVEVEIWKANLSAARAEVERCLRLLSPDERARAGRCPGEDARARLVIGRALLRSLLGERLGVAPGEVRFAYGGKGKPRLAGVSGAPAFNVAHSGDVILIALGGAGCPELGIDVERMDARRRPGAVVARYGTERERQAYLALVPGERPQAFLRWWTRKEALAKAAGGSLWETLRAVEVPFGADPVHCLAAFGAARWLTYTWEPQAGYVSSLAVPLTAAGGGCVQALRPEPQEARTRPPAALHLRLALQVPGERAAAAACGLSIPIDPTWID